LFSGAEGGDLVASLERLARVDEESDLSSLEASPVKPSPRKEIEALRQAKKRRVG
jgi:HAMP domain-containing protein